MSNFMDFYRSVRNNLENPKSLDWVLHTNLGQLYLLRLEPNEQDGIVCVHCHDEAGSYRYIAFRENQLASFSLEIRRRVSKNAEERSIGFKTSRTAELVSELDVDE